MEEKGTLEHHDSKMQKTNSVETQILLQNLRYYYNQQDLGKSKEKGILK